MVGDVRVMLHIRMFQGTKGVSTVTGYAVVKQFKYVWPASSRARMLAHDLRIPRSADLTPTQYLSSPGLGAAFLFCLCVP